MDILRNIVIGIFVLFIIYLAIGYGYWYFRQKKTLKAYYAAKREKGE